MFSPYRPLPPFEDPQPDSTADTHGQIRNWLEELTGTNPYLQIDWKTYQTVLQWTSRDDYRPIIEQIIKRRITIGEAASYKAIILAQALPPSSLLELIEPLEKLLKAVEDEIPPHLHVIASSVLSMAQNHKSETEAKKKEEDEKYNWDTWCGLYGRPMGAYDWRPLPKETEWGMWGLVWVSPEEWWKTPDKTD